MSGPKKRPLALVRLEGNPSRRKLPTKAEEIRVPPVAPDCPVWLDKVAKAEWAYVVPQLTAMGLIGKIDRAELEAYCKLRSSWLRLMKDIDDRGERAISEKGYEYANPDVATAGKYLATILKICADFGMSASARARMSIPGKKDDDEFDELLKDVR